MDNGGRALPHDRSGRCRCRADGDSNTPLCACTSGYHCVDVLTAGGVGVQGAYCVPNDLCTEDEDCGGAPGSCQNGVCAAEAT